MPSEHEFQARPEVWLNLVRAGLALLPAALVGWVGWWVLAVPAVVLVSLLLGRRLRIPHGQWDVAVTATTLLGGIVGVSSAGLAIAEVGGLQPYDTRVALGWTALALAAAATGVGLSIPGRAAASSIAMVFAGLVGALAISFFYVNTFYFVAVPLWLVAAMSRLASPSAGRRSPRPTERTRH